MKGRLTLATASLAALSGCAEETHEPASFYGDGCTLDTEAALCDDCIEFAHVTRLGSDALGPGYLVEMASVVRDAQGNFWVGQNEEIKVFDADGAFLRTVGRQGDGPMEFGRAAPMHVDAAGRVHVFDTGNLRVSVIDQDWTLAGEKKLPTWVSAVAPLDDGDRYVVQASIEEPGSEGMPLHIIDGTGVLKSFGSGDDANTESPESLPADLQLAVGPDGRVFAARMADYVIEAWSREGVRLGALRGEPQLMNTYNSFQGLPSPDNPPPNIIADVHADPDGMLWVSLAVRRPGWLDAYMQMARAGSDDIASEAADDLITGIYQGRLDVIDLSTCTMIASQLHDRMLMLLNERTVAGFGFTELGSFALDIMRVRLSR